MTIDSLRLVRNVLLRTFIIGVAFAVLLMIVTLLAWDTWLPMTIRTFHTDEATIVPIVIRFFVDLRFYLLFILLAPGLAIHWTIKKEQAAKK